MGNNYQFTVQRTVIVSPEDIDDIMVAALEGGISYWCRQAIVVDKYLGEFASDQISRGGILRLCDAESADTWELTCEKFLAGLKMWTENGGSINRDGTLDTCDIDAEDADMIVQYALFGEVVFG